MQIAGMKLPAIAQDVERLIMKLSQGEKSPFRLCPILAWPLL